MCVHRESGAQRAVKVLRKSHMDDDEKRMLFNEINILKEIVSSLILRPLFLRALMSQGPSSNKFYLMCRTTLTSSRCTSSSRTISAITWSPRFARVVSYSMRFSSVVSSVSAMELSS